MLFLVVGCSEQKNINLPGGNDDIINKSQITAIESRITGENKLILEKEAIVFEVGERIAIAMAINNIMPITKDFRIILSNDDETNVLLTENSFNIIDIKENDFEILPLIINVPEEINITSYSIEINIEYKESENEWKAYDNKVIRLTLRE